MILLFIHFEKIATPTQMFQIIFFYPQKRFYGKCNYMSFGSNPDRSDLNFNDSTKIPSAGKYVVLGVMIDKRLGF